MGSELAVRPKAKDLQVQRPTAMMSLAEITGYAQLFFDAKMFANTASMAQAAVKIQAGAEIGLQPFESMKALHIINGNVTMAGHAIAAKVKSSGRYDYRIDVSDEKLCSGAFIDRALGKEFPHEYDWEDATRTGDADKPMYKKHPKAMLFNRWISSGQKIYAPDATNGVLVYTADELGGQIDADGAPVQEATIVEPEKPRGQSPEAANEQAGYEAELLRADQEAMKKFIVVNKKKVAEAGKDEAAFTSQLEELGKRLQAEFKCGKVMMGLSADQRGQYMMAYRMEMDRLVSAFVDDIPFEPAAPEPEKPAAVPKKARSAPKSATKPEPAPAPTEAVIVAPDQQDAAFIAMLEADADFREHYEKQYDYYLREAYPRNEAHELAFLDAEKASN